MKYLSCVFCAICIGVMLSFSGISVADTPAPALNRISVADSNLTILNYVLISKQRVGRTDYNYTYRADVKNNGSDVQNCTASLSGTSANTTIVDGSLSFGNVDEGSVVTSSDTFTIRQNRRYPFDPTTLIWSITYEECQFPSLWAPDLPSPLLSGITSSITVPVCYSGPQILIFHLMEGPPGMTINTTSGTISWNPPVSMEGQNAFVKVSVTDGIIVDRVEFDIPVALTTPIATSVTNNTITVTETGNLQGLSVTLPENVLVSIPIDQIQFSELEENQVPTIPDNIIRLTDIYRTSPVPNTGDDIVITLPNISLPENRYPFELILYTNTYIDTNSGDSVKVWVPTQLNMNINQNGQVTIVTNNIGNASFIGLIAKIITGISPTVETSETFDGTTCNCEPKKWLIPNLIPPHIPLFDEIVNGNHQICTIEGEVEFQCDIYDFNDNNWGGSNTVNELAYWAYQAQGVFHHIALQYDDKIKIRIEQVDSPSDPLSPRYVGYVTSSDNRRTIHLDQDAWAKDTIHTTVFHEYFHQAQSRTTVDGLTNILANNLTKQQRGKFAWIYEGTARWFEDYDILDNINTYSWMSPLSKILNNKLDRYIDGNNEYKRFAFFKMLESRCSNFNIKDIVNVDFTNDPTGVENLATHLSSFDWNCDFCDGFGSNNNNTLASALLDYQYSTVKQDDISLLDFNENNFNFTTTVTQTLNPATNQTSLQIGVPANGARSYTVMSVGVIPSGKEVFVRITATGNGAWVSFVENDINNSSWIDTTSQTEFVYGHNGSAPELFVTVVNPSTENSTNVSLATGIRDIPADVLTIASPSANQNYNNRVITVNGTIPASLNGAVSKVLIEQPNISGSMNIANISGSTFSGKAVIRLGQNTISVVGLDSNNNRITSPTTVSFTGIEHSNSTAQNALIKSNMVYVLQWDTNYSDLDMYVTDPSNQTIWYGNRSISGRAHQDVDDVNGYGPEVTTYFTNGNAPAGNYEVNINYYSTHGAGTTHYTVDVLLNEGSNAPVTGCFHSSYPNNPVTSASYGSGFPPSTTNSSWGADVIKVNCRGTGEDQNCALD